MLHLSLLPSLLAMPLAAPPPPAVAEDPTVLSARVVQIDPAHSVMSFSVKHFGFTRVRGQFREWGGYIFWDEEDVTRSSFTIVVKTGTLDTGLERRDNDLKSDQFFDVEAFPIAVFQSTRIEKDGDGLIAYGDLTIRDVTKEVGISFQVVGTREFGPGMGRVFASGTVTISREEFGLTNALDRIARNLAVVSDKVEIELEIQGAALDLKAMPFDSEEKPSIGEELVKLVEADGAAAAIEKFNYLRENRAEEYNFSRGQVIIASHHLMDANRYEDALEIAKLAVHMEEEPSRQAIATMVLIHAKRGDNEAAIQQCKKMLELDEHDALALEMLRQLEG